MGLFLQLLPSVLWTCNLQGSKSLRCMGLGFIHSCIKKSCDSEQIGQRSGDIPSFLCVWTGNSIYSPATREMSLIPWRHEGTVLPDRLKQLVLLEKSYGPEVSEETSSSGGTFGRRDQLLFGHSGGKWRKPSVFPSVVTEKVLSARSWRTLPVRFPAGCVRPEHCSCCLIRSCSQSEQRWRCAEDAPSPHFLWPLSFHCHYINSFVGLARTFLRNELFKFCNLIIPRLSSYLDLIKEIKMCFLFVSIPGHHLLKNVDIISPWKVWETDHVYKEVSLLLKRHVNKILKSPRGRKKNLPEFLVERDFVS